MPSRPKLAVAVVGVLAVVFGLHALLQPAYEHAAPTDLRALGRSPHAITLAWYPVDGVTRYRVRYSTKPDFTSSQSKSFTLNSGPIMPLKPFTTYYFSVAAVSSDGKKFLSPWSRRQSAKTKPPTTPIRVGSFNISDPENGVWKERRLQVAADLVSEDLDVVGIQEAYGDGDRRSLLEAVNAAARPRHRQYVMSYPIHDIRGKDNRILYDPKRVRLEGLGFEKYAKQAPDGNDKDYERDMIWATFRERQYGKRFLFATTHLSPVPTPKYDKAQWKQLIFRVHKVNSVNNPRLPVIIVGDFNTSKFQRPGDSMISEMTRFGFGDVLGQRYGTRDVGHPRARTRIDAWLGSFNNYRRSTKSYRVLPNHIGDNIDWIFATNSLRVQRWRTVAHHANGQLVGTIGSDHFLVTATIVLP